SKSRQSAGNPTSFRRITAFSLKDVTPASVTDARRLVHHCGGKLFLEKPRRLLKLAEESVEQVRALARGCTLAIRHRQRLKYCRQRWPRFKRRFRASTSCSTTLHSE